MLYLSPEDWNDDRDTDHPLHDVPLGYLAHMVVCHGAIPWQMIGSIRAIDVDVQVAAPIVHAFSQGA